VILNTINSGINQGTQIIENTVQYADGIVLKFASNNPPIPDSNLTGDLSETTHPVESIQWISKPEDLPRIFIFQKKIFKAIRKKFLMAQAQLLPLAALLLLIGPAREFIFIMLKIFN